MKKFNYPYSLISQVLNLAKNNMTYSFLTKKLTPILLSLTCLSSLGAQAQNINLVPQGSSPNANLSVNLNDIEQEVLNRAKLSFCDSQSCALISNLKIVSFDNVSGKIVLNLTVSASQLTLVETPLNLVDMEISSIKKDKDNFNSVQVSPDNYLLLLIPKTSPTTFTIEAKILPGTQSTSLKKFGGYIDLNQLSSLSLDNSNQQEQILRFQSAPMTTNDKGDKTQSPTSNVNDKPQVSNLQVMPQIVIDRQLSLTNNALLQTQISTMNQHSSVGQVDLTFEKMEGEEILKGRNFVSGQSLKVNYLPGTRTDIESQLNLSHLNFKNTTPYVQRLTLKQDDTWDIKYSVFPQIKNKNQMVWWLLPDENVVLDIQKLLVAPGTPIAIQSVRLKSNYSFAKPQFTQEVSISSSMGAKVLLDKRHMSDYEIESIFLNERKISFDRQPSTLLYPLILNSGSNKVKVVFNAPSGKTKLIDTQKILQIISDTQQSIPARNFSTEITGFKNKWLLWSWGADFKPSILLWGIVIVIAVAAYAAGKFLPMLGLSALSWFLLMTGLTQYGVGAIIVAIIWFTLLYVRREYLKFEAFEKPLIFNVFQILIICVGAYLFILFFDSISSGLLGSAQSFIAGPSSYDTLLYFYSQNPGSTATVFWLPVWCYRTLMFAWSIWLAFKAVAWVRVAWESYSAGGIWRHTLVSTASQPVKDIEVEHKS